ncbi:TPA: SLC45 family MFS transporter [Kluyvera ascorbata]|uniref:MFS transporter n=1 Tax=Kluyvera genomosp. 2 TaxID=2774054 RepID=A0A2T2Y6E8_9ENTR|nr:MULTISPECIES: MFS transporter [Enterobacteriaceae]HAT3917409.1 SLC45 family MFS transporter [Kluyvera ascorbata]PSR48105.1 MFS transporter [Kluyvera genomosp. 2]BBQ84698.1 MFS transporter [Klebsiella sp. WP3-W18-ESBL-02]BBR21748.1 MFS transporter [Klebsiella sp. WP3-S18-ESBL-05]HAT3942322.1 SLC45 family MFS transporter [Kluyvera ascorbata]
MSDNSNAIAPLDASNKYNKNTVENTLTVTGTKKRILLVSLFTNFFVLLALYCGVISVLLPNHIAQIDPANKANNLAIVMTTALLFTILAQPIAGALSDRCRSTWGRRSPWIVGGALLGGLAIFGISMATTVAGIAAFWLMAAVSLNCMNGPLATVVADRFRPENRGIASGFVGAGSTAGGTVGIILAGYLAWNLQLGYLVFGLAIAACCLAFVLINREPSARTLPTEPFQWGTFFKSFWVSPREYPDFGWAFFGRFTMYLGYQGVVTYQLYILQDYIGLSVQESNYAIGTISVITLVTLLFSGLISGVLSDRWQRRKIFVFASSVLMAAGLMLPLIMPTLTGMYIYAAILGLGYGAYTSIDMALMTQVLPGGGKQAGKDMGILTIATVLPQSFSPILSAWLLSAFDNNYSSLFIAAIIFVFASSFFVLPIKSVK